MAIAYFCEKLKIKREHAAIFVVLAAALILRLYHLGFRDFWYDEVASFYYSQHPLNNWNPPLYWILLHFWIKVFGASEFSLRFPSLLFSLISVFLVYLLGKRLFSPRAGIYAAVFMAFSPFHIQYAQEARPYSLSLYLGILSTYMLFMALTERKERFWLAFVLVTAAGFYSNINYYHIFLLIAQAVCALTLLRGKGARVFFYLLFPVLSFLPWAPNFIEKFNWIKNGDFWWISQPKWETIYETIKRFDFRDYAVISQSYNFAATAIVILLLASLLLALKSLKEKHGNVMLCLVMLILPMALIFIISRMLLPVYLIRGLIILSPYYYIILALGLSNLKTRWLKAVMAGLLVFFYCEGAHRYFSGDGVKKHFKEAAGFLADNIKQGEIVIFASMAASYPILFYGQGKISPVSYALTRDDFLNKSGPLFSRDNVWFVYCMWGRGINLDMSEDRDTLMLRKHLEANFRNESKIIFDEGLEVLKYTALR